MLPAPIKTPFPISTLPILVYPKILLVLASCANICTLGAKVTSFPILINQQ